MKEKFYLPNGEKVQLGDTIYRKMGRETEYVLVTKKELPKLIKMGVLTVGKSADKSVQPALKDSKVPMDLEFYIQKIADRLGWEIEKVYNFLDNVDTIFPVAAFSIVLKEIAVELDKKYEDHISNSPEIYVISILDGRISTVNKASIKNYRNFAAFRNIEDAKIACRITKNILKELFSNKNGK